MSVNIADIDLERIHQLVHNPFEISGVPCKDFEQYYADALIGGATEYPVEESKRTTTSMDAILANPDRLKCLFLRLMPRHRDVQVR